MKRNKLIKHLEAHGCTLKRHGNKHDIFANEALNTQTTIPRIRILKICCVKKFVSNSVFQRFKVNNQAS